MENSKSSGLAVDGSVKSSIMDKKKNEDCLICDRIQLIKNGENPYFVKELETGYVVIGDYQFFRGYTLFLCKIHTNELHKLEPKFKKSFWRKWLWLPKLYTILSNPEN